MFYLLRLYNLQKKEAFCTMYTFNLKSLFLKVVSCYGTHCCHMPEIYDNFQKGV